MALTKEQRQLTSKQESFAQACLDPDNNASDAYRLIYDASNMTPEAINTEASRLIHHPKVSQRIIELRNEIIGAKAWDVERIAEEYGINVYGAREDKQWSASNAAITGIGKALGILTDKVDVNITHTIKPGMSLEELEARIQRLNVLEAGIVEGESKVVEDSE